MSVFKGHDDLSLNRYYYSFYSFSQDDPNTIKSFVYDQNQTLVSSKDISFNTRNIPDMLSFLENSQSNPYALGKSNDEFLNMDIAFAGLYKKALTEKQQQSLMTSINKTYKNVFYGTVNTFTIQVTQSAQDPSKSVFIFNGDTSVENPMVPVGTVGLYIFDQSHPSNAGFPIAFRNTQSPFTPYTNVIVEGTPGTANSYSLVSITDVSAPLLVEYYTTSTETNAEFIFGELLNYLYQVKVETNIVGDPVFAIQSPGQSAYVLQPDLSFNIGDLEYFYVGDDSMADISLVFGPTVDDTANVVGSPYYVKMGDIIRLDLTSGYTGDPLVYFEDSSAGMGYLPAGGGGINSDAVINLSFDIDGTNSGSYGSSGDMTFTHDTIDTANAKYGNGALYINSSRETRTNYNQNKNTISTVFSSIPQNWCISLWMKASAWVATNHAVITTFTTEGKLLIAFNSANYLFLFLNGEYVQPAGTNIPSDINPFDNAYHHYFFKFEGQLLTAYIDGTEITSQTFTNSNNVLPGNTLSNFSVGDIRIAENDIDNSATMYYDDVRIFDKIVSIDEAKKEIPLTVLYTVDVANSVFRLNSGSGFVEKLAVSFNSGTTYIFDQSHDSNANNTLIIGTAPDISSSIVSSGLTIMGTPGQPGAYTKYVSDGSTVYYFSYQTENMGEEPLTYTVKVVDHEITGEKVFSFKASGTSTFINQPDLSFGAGDRYQFDVTDSTMTDISLVFGTTVDDSASINESVVTRYEGMILLDISAGYDGDRLVYFEDSSAGMGYKVYSTSQVNNLNTIFNGVTQPTFYWDFRTTSPQNDGTNEYVTDIIGDSLKAVAYGTSFDNLNGPDLSYNKYLQIDPFTFGSPCSIEVYYNIHTQNLGGRIIDFGIGGTDTGDLVLIYDSANHEKLSVYASTKYYEGSQTLYNVWEHGILTLDSDGNLKFYRDKSLPLDSGGNPRITVTGANITTVNRTVNYIGRDAYTGGTEELDGQVAFTRVWNGHVLTESEISILYDNRDVRYVNIQTLVYTVTVPGDTAVFYLDNESGPTPKPAVDFANNSGTVYIFDQSHVSNANNTLVIGTAPDISSSIVSSGLTIMGTPGQPGAYTKYVSDGSTVYYFSYQTENMGEKPPTYTVKVVDHEVTGEKIFSLKAPGTSTFISQPDLSFGAGDKYQFDVTDSTMTDISLVFGTTVDDSTSINESVVTRYEGMILLDISAGYDGDRLVYFEDSSAGMGYVSSSSSSGTSGTAPQLLNNSFENNDLVDVEGTTTTFYVLQQHNKNIDNWTTIVMEGHNRTFIIRDDDTAGFNFPTPFVDGSYCMGLEASLNTGYLQQIITLPVNNYILSWYDVLRTYPGMVSVPIRIKITKEADSTVIHTHDYLVTNTAWAEKTTSFSITEEVPYIVSFESYNNDDTSTRQAGFDKVTFSIAQPPVENYTVDVLNSVFRLDSGDGNGFVEKPAIDFANNSGTVYIFDQSDDSNANNTLVIGTTFDDPASIVSSGLTIMGTPGQPGAYTKYVSDGSTVHYFSYQTENMGLAPPNITDDLYVHYDFEFPLYDANGTAYSTDVTGGGYERIYNKAYDSITNSDISYNAYVAGYGGGVFLNSTIYKIGSSSAFVNGSSIRNGTYTFLLNSTQGYSVAFWMKEDTVKGPLFGLSNNSGYNTAFFYIDYNATDFIVHNNGKTITSNISALTMTDWNHIAFTMSSDGLTWKLYINRTLVQTKTDGNYLTSVGPISGYPTDSVWLADIGGNAGNTSCKCYFDDFRFYKTELDQAQVNAVYSYTG